MRPWRTLVAEGKAAVRKEGEALWELADLALEVAPTLGASSEGRKTLGLAEFSEAINVEYATLVRYRAVAIAWPKPRPRGISFSALFDLAPQPDRVEVLARLQARGPVTKGAVRAEIGRRQQNAPSAAERAATVAEHLSDPAVRRAVVRDRQASIAVEQTNRERELDFNRRADQRAAADPTMRAVASIVANQLVSHTRDWVRAIELSIQGDIDDEDLAVLLSLVGNALAKLESYRATRGMERGARA